MYFDKFSHDPSAITLSVAIRASTGFVFLYLTKNFVKNNWMYLLSYSLLHTWASNRDKYVSMHLQLCFKCGHQSRENELLWCPSIDWHRGFQPWSMEAAAFHPNWTLQQLIELDQQLEEKVISEMSCCSGWRGGFLHFHGWWLTTSANLWQGCQLNDDGLDLHQSNMAQKDQIQAIWGYLHPTAALTSTWKARWTTK